MVNKKVDFEQRGGEGVGRSAVISDCEQYRYMLARELRPGINPRTLMWVMLNPSTADAYEDDPTIRRCVGFARTWNYDRVTVANLFAYRATDPRALLGRGNDIIGPRCDDWIKRLANEATIIVAAWGRWGQHFPARVERVKNIVRRYDVNALGFTRDGKHPLHPLMQPADAQLTRWRY